MLDMTEMHLPTSQNQSADVDGACSSSIRSVVATLQRLLDNSDVFKLELQDRAMAVRREIKYVFEAQRVALQQRESDLLGCLEDIVIRQSFELESQEQDVEQIMLDLDGYEALLQAKAESGVGEDKLQAWITSTLLGASNLCQSIANKEHGLYFSCQDLGEIISNFGEVGEDSHVKSVAKEPEDDCIGIVQDGQWLHGNSISFYRADSTTGKRPTDRVDDQAPDGKNDLHMWRVISKDECRTPCSDEMSMTSSVSGESWLVSSTSNDDSEVTMTTAVDTKEAWLVGGQAEAKQAPVQPPCNPEWLCQSSMLFDSNNEIKELDTRMSLIDICDLSKWLQKKEPEKSDDDLCKWLAGKSDAQCTSCNTACPFEDAKFGKTDSQRKKWLSTATNW